MHVISSSTALIDLHIPIADLQERTLREATWFTAFMHVTSIILQGKRKFLFKSIAPPNLDVWITDRIEGILRGETPFTLVLHAPSFR